MGGVKEVRMRTQGLLKDSHFEEIAEVKPDTKNRIALGQKLAHKANFYRVYQNDAGQIVLDPLETIPAHEAWLFRNKQASASVLKGLDQARQGKLVKSKEDFSKYLKDDP